MYTSVSNLSERLNLSHDDGEKWIVNLIRETRMGADAKIDLEKVCFFFFLLVSSYYYSVMLTFIHTERH